MKIHLPCILALFLSSATFAQETTASSPPFEAHFGPTANAALWKNAVKTVKELLRTKRSGSPTSINNDVYADSLLDLITDELVFQGEAVWLDVSLGSKFKDPMRRKEQVFKRLQSEESIDRSKQFLEQYCYQLADGYKACGVPPEYVSGIANIETFFGSFDNVRKFPVLATLVTWVALQNEALRNDVAKNILAAIKADRTNKVIEGASRMTASFWTTRMERRANTSLVQLRDYLNLAETLAWDHEKLLRLEGSWVGAFTDFQFMPRTFRYTMLESENPDPEKPEQIVPLVARYLGRSWGDGSPAQVRKAVGSYNSPHWYIDHVDTVAQRVRAYSIELLAEREAEQKAKTNSSPVEAGKE